MTGIGTEIATETMIATEIGIEIAITTTTASITTTTEMTGDTWTGTGETTAAMIAVMTATTGAGTDTAGSIGMGTDGSTKKLMLALSKEPKAGRVVQAFRLFVAVKQALFTKKKRGRHSAAPSAFHRGSFTGAEYHPPPPDCRQLQ
jgi:hypothetical protein